MRNTSAFLFISVFVLGAVPAEAQYNPGGWIQTPGWNMLLLEQTFGCGGGGAATMMGNWVAPYEMAEENPRAGDDWQIDFAEARSTGWGALNIGEDPTWVSSEWLETEEGLFINTGDQIDYNSIAGQLGMVNDNTVGIATTYIENFTGEPLEVQLCTASDDSIRVDVNDYIAVNNSVCRGSSVDCQERTCAELAPGMNKVTVYVWEGGGGWNFRLGVIDPLTGVRLDDISGEDFGIIFHGNGDDDALEGQVLDEAPGCFADQEIGGGEAQPFDLGGWIGTAGWNFILLDQADGCGGGGLVGMQANWLAPYDLGEEDPRAGEEWDIDFAAARSRGWTLTFLAALPTWLSSEFLTAEGLGIPVGDLVDYNAIAQSLGIANDNMVGIATTYIENTTDAPVGVDLCTASDDSIRVDINNFTVLVKNVCRGSSGDCQEITCTELAPGMNKVTTYVWEGGGGWNFRIGLKDPATGQLLSGALADAAGIVFHGTGADDELAGQVLDEAPGCDLVFNPGNGFPPIEEGANASGWIRSSAWNMLLLDQNGGCSGGGIARMAGQWVAPYNMAEENPRAGDEWEIDFLQAESMGWPGRFSNTPTWISLNYIRSLGNNLASADLVDFNSMASAVLNGTDNKVGIATTYIENLTGDPQLVELCTASDDSIRVDVNNYMAVNKSVCRGSGQGDCQERICAELAPGINKVTVYVFEGGGGWNFRLGLTDPVTGIRLDDVTGEDFGLIFHGTGEDDDLEGQVLEVEPECHFGEVIEPGDPGEPMNPLAAGVNPSGWIQSHAWNLLFPLLNPFGCGGGGAATMEGNWVEPYEMIDEDPQAGDAWPDIDFGFGLATGFDNGGMTEEPTWVSTAYIAEEFGVDLPAGDLVNFEDMTVVLSNSDAAPFVAPNDNVMGIVTTYVINNLAEPLPVDVCTASDDAITVHVNGELVTSVSACRGSGGNACQETGPAVLDPGLNRIRVQVWEGGGGWNFRLGLRESGDFQNLSDGNELIEFLGADLDAEPGGPGNEICDNGVDDDEDGDVDCADADCAAAANCKEPPPPADPWFLRGDSDDNNLVNLTDAIFTLNYLFLGGGEPPCLDAADTDNNGLVQLTDAIFLLNYLFLGGRSPPEPANECGFDPEEPADGIGCETFSSCP